MFPNSNSNIASKFINVQQSSVEIKMFDGEYDSPFDNNDR